MTDKQPEMNEAPAHPTEQQSSQDVGKLERTLQDSEEQVKVYIDRLKRLQADFENYKKRAARDQEEYVSLVENRLLLKILPLYDNLERAFRSYNHNNDKDTFIEGMERIFVQMSDFLRSQQVQPILALGQPFDPSLHEALLLVETDERPNLVLEEFEPGYRRGDRLLRPSRVKVSRKRQIVTEASNSNDTKKPLEGGN